jgi:hypothetical protein
MPEPDKIIQEKASTGPAIDIAIRIGVIALLIVLCFQILRPFISLVIWGAILGTGGPCQVGGCHNYCSYASCYHPPQRPNGRLACGWGEIYQRQDT